MNTTGLYHAPAPLAFATMEGKPGVLRNQLVLTGDELWYSPRKHAGVTIHVVEGIVWITEEGDSHDYVLREGEDFHSAGNTQVVAQSLCGRSRMMVQQ